MPKNRKEITQLIKRYRLNDFENVITKGLEPAVDLIPGKPVKRKLPAGRSKFGGEPDLHDPSDWPREPAGRPLHFLAQIRLSDLPPRHISRSVLPAQGWLWFWYDSLGEWEENEAYLRTDWRTNGFQVTFSPSERKPVLRCPFPEFSEPKVPKAVKRKRRFRSASQIYVPSPEASLRYKPMYSLNRQALDFLHQNIDDLDPENGWDRLSDFRYQSVMTNHQLLGESDDYFDGDYREECHLALKAKSKGQSIRKFWHDPTKPVTNRQKKQWRLLLDLGSDDKFNWYWSDLGSLYFWIREQDLAKQVFSKVHGIIRSA